MKVHLKRIVFNVKLTFEELMTVFAQVKACMNSRHLTLLESNGEEGIEGLTPGNFLVEKHLTSIPDSPPSHQLHLSLLRRWHLCQTLARHFWRRWSDKYLVTLNNLNKWWHPTRNVQLGDIVLIREDNTTPAHWPLATVIDIHLGNDHPVRVITVKTSNGVYKRPIAKIILLLPVD